MHVDLYKPGDVVHWWRRRSKEVWIPYKAAIVGIGAKRISIIVDVPGGREQHIVRHVKAASLQKLEMYWEKAANQEPYLLEPARFWGRCTRLLEIGEDLFALRHVDVFENGNILSYDRRHWIDLFGMLASARLRRGNGTTFGGGIEETTRAEFEDTWRTARGSAIWRRQKRNRRAPRGSRPPWLSRVSPPLR